MKIKPFTIDENYKYIFNFGKYKGKELFDIVDKDMKYIHWVFTTGNIVDKIDEDLFYKVIPLLDQYIIKVDKKRKIKEDIIYDDTKVDLTEWPSISEYKKQMNGLT